MQYVYAYVYYIHTSSDFCFCYYFKLFSFYSFFVFVRLSCDDFLFRLVDKSVVEKRNATTVENKKVEKQQQQLLR